MIEIMPISPLRLEPFPPRLHAHMHACLQRRHEPQTGAKCKDISVKLTGLSHQGPRWWESSVREIKRRSSPQMSTLVAGVVLLETSSSSPKCKMKFEMKGCCFETLQIQHALQTKLKLWRDTLCVIEIYILLNVHCTISHTFRSL